MITKFTDNAGTEWTVTVNVAVLKRAKASLGIDLGKLFDEKLKGLSELIADTVTLVDALYVTCSASHPEITDEQFGAALGGDCLENATAAFVEGLLDFFPNPKGRKALRQILNLTEKAQRELQTEAETAMEKELSRPELMDEIKAQLKSATNSRGSAA